MLERIPALPANLKPIPRDGGRVILAYGEVTGHAHAIMEREVEQFAAADAPPDSGVTFLEVKEALALLQHDEHSTIELPAGFFRVTRQREYSPEAIRRVAD